MSTTLYGMDFSTVATLTGPVLFVLVLLTHQRRRIIHVNVTTCPRRPWTAQQIVEAFSGRHGARWLLRDRDAITGDVFRRRVAGHGYRRGHLESVSPWQNPYDERLIGSTAGSLDPCIVLGERHCGVI